MGLLSLCTIFVYVIEEAPTDKNFKKKLINNYPVYAHQIPSNLDFAGDAMLLKSPDIYECMDKDYW